MKRIATFLFALLLTVGCSNGVFESKVAEGKEAIINGNYEKALVSFDSALKEDSNDEEAEVLINQTTKMIEAIEQQEKGNPYEAIALFEQVKIMEDGFDKLNEQAEERKEVLQRKEQDKYNTQLTIAENLKDNKEYEEAKELIRAIIYGTECFEYLEKQHEQAIEMFAEVG